MKKLLAIALCMALVGFGAFGCKKTEEPVTPEDDTTTVETPEEPVEMDSTVVEEGEVTEEPVEEEVTE